MYLIFLFLTQIVRSFGFYVILAGIVSYGIWIKTLRQKAKEILPDFSFNDRENSDRLEKHISILLLFGGLLVATGARLFSILEHSGQFIEAPLYVLLSGSKFSFYGGLLGGILATLYYARKNHLAVLGLLDASVPALLIGYFIIRLGCHVSGHGDWGIANLSQKPDWLSLAPDWLWAYNYPDNSAGKGIFISNSTGNLNTILQYPVFPTPLYESLFSCFLFILLSLFQKKINWPGFLFSIYLVAYGIERLLIEQIRTYQGDYITAFNLKPVELVTSLYILTGLALALHIYSKRTARRTFNHW